MNLNKESGMADIVFPNNNEAEFIYLAERLGHFGLIFVYDKKKDTSSFQKKTKLILSSKTKSEIIDSSKVKDAFSKKESTIFNLEIQEKDFLHTRNSGLNHVLAKEAVEKDISIGFSLSLILSSEKKSQILGRMIQNIRICNKYGVKMTFASFAVSPWQMRAKSEVVSFFKELK